jgi:phosphopantothenoylcysteine synthetase/decarboxylase
MLADKHVDLVVYNDVGRSDIGFDSVYNEVTIVSAGGDRVVERAPKPAVAAAILDEVERLLGER